MEAYSLELTDKNGRPVIKKPINIDGLLRREDRSMDVGKGVRVYLEEMPSSLPRGYEPAPDAARSGDPSAMHAASQRHGFDDSVHAPFGFGEVQQWFDVIQAVQQGNVTETDDERGAPRRATTSSPKRATSPERQMHQSTSMHHHHLHGPPPGAPPIPPASMTQREQWASYAPPLPGGPRDFKRVVALDVTPDPKMRKFSPLPMALHSCVMVEKGASGTAHFLVFGGTNGRSDEAEWYEFSLASASWRRIEGKRQVPGGCHSHTCVALQHGARIAVVGGVSYDGQSHVPEHLVEENPAAVKRLALLCPKSALPTRLGRTASLVDSTRQQQQQATTAHGTSGGGRGPVAMDALIPQLAAASGVHLSSPLGRTRKRRAFQSVAYDTDVSTMRWRMVQPPVAINIAAHTATVFGSMVYLFGGVNELLEVSDKLIACNPTNYSARILRAQDVAPCARYYHTAVAYGHWIVVYGGFNANNEPLNDIWAFDCVHESWEQLTTVGHPPPRAGHAACVVGCRMLLIGGFDAALDGEDAAPLNTVVEVNLVPTAKGYLLKQLPVGGTAALPPIAFASATACGDYVSVFVFGGITVKPKKKRSTVDGAKPKKADESSDAYSSDDDFDEHTSEAHVAHAATGAGVSAASHLFHKFPVTNKAFLLTFAEARASSAKHKDKGPKLNHLGLPIDENELSPGFQAFVRKQADFEKKREFERLKIIRKTRLEETEAAEVSLYLDEKEIASLLSKCEVCCNTLMAYDMKTLPGHVPDRDERARMVEECIGHMKQARDVMRSMKGHEGPKQVKSKGHRKKTGEKFEDHSAAKPFRRVIVMDLIHSTNRYMVALRKMNKSLKTVEWPEKAAYMHFIHEIHRELVELVDLIKEILEKYINNRVESLVQAEKKQQEKLATLKEIVAKIQHDKIFKKDVPDARREQRKQVLQRDDRRNKEQADGKKTRRRRKSRSASPGSKHAALPAPGKEFKEVLIEIPKEEGKQLMKRCDWVQKAATEFAWHCANNMSVQQPVVAADGTNAQAPPPPRTVQQETVLRDADAARSAAITLSNAIASSSYAFRTMLEADVTAATPPPTVAATAQQQSAVTSAKASQAEATAANATVVDPQAPPIVPALPKDALVEKARDPSKNMMLRLSSVRPLLDNHASLRDLLHTIGRIRLNKWDPNDLGGPKQDEQAEKLCRALFHRETNLLTRVNAAFLMHKGARSPRKKVHREDPLMMTSEAMQQKLKARKAVASPQPAPAVATGNRNGYPPSSTVCSSYATMVPAITSTTGGPSVAPSGVGVASTAGHPYPIQRYDGNDGRTVVDAPAAPLSGAHMTFYRPMAPMEQTFAYAMPPTADSRPTGGGVGDCASGAQHAWFLNPPQYERSATTSGAGGVAGTSVTVVKAPPAAPTELFVRSTPPPAEAVVQLHGAPPPKTSPTTAVPAPTAVPATQPPVPKSTTDSSIPPPRATTPPPPPQASPTTAQPATSNAAVPPTSSSSTAALSTSTAGTTPAATSSAAAPAASAVAAVPATGPVTVQSYAAATSGAAKPSGSSGNTAGQASNPVSPVPVAPPAWMKVPSMALPPSASTSAANNETKAPGPDALTNTGTTASAGSTVPPVPVSVAPGPFNGGVGFLGTHAPIEDYMAVMMPTPAAVGVSPFSPPVTAKKKEPTTAGSRTANSAGGGVPAVTSTNPNFRGKLTPGERMILKSRDSNRH